MDPRPAALLPDTRRAARLLGLSWAVAWVAVPISGAFVSVIVVRLTGNDSLAGVPFALLYLASLLAGFPSGYLMDRFGRKPVLIAGHLIGGLGFAIGAVAIILQSLWLFFIGHFIGAIGATSTYLTRLAAADLYPASQRARGLGRLVFYLVFGALLAVPLTLLAQRLEPVFGQSFLALAWGLAPILSIISASLIARIQPDPKETGLLIQSLEPPPAQPVVPGLRHVPWRAIVTAGGALLFAQAAMASIMSVTGASLDHAGHNPGYISGTLTFHVVGMFAFGPFIGILGDKWGRKPLLFVSAAYLLVSNLTTALVPDSRIHSLSLFGVGIGWSFAFLGATTILADAARAAHRGRLLGIVDVGVAASGGAASILAGVALHAGGIQQVAELGLLLSLGVLVAAIMAPGGRAARIPAAPPSPTPTLDVGK
ncbi:MAG TPA: MFS transporter [Candidatus Thermoplasmatota archaeon]|nr:MFS transporter [Candidatus Thermoplasmatota archaeon]